MQIHTELVKKSFFIFMFLTLLGCSQQKLKPQKIVECKIGSTCVLQGKLKIYVSTSGAVGVLNGNNECMGIALPKIIIEERKNWDGRDVIIQGITYSNYYSPEMISFRLIDRDVLVGKCELDKIIYLNEISIR